MVENFVMQSNGCLYYRGDTPGDSHVEWQALYVLAENGAVDGAQSLKGRVVHC